MTPSVPTIVTASGRIPSRTKSLATGVKSLVTPARASRLSKFLPFGGELVTRVGQQFWQRLGLSDDRQEVRVAGPAGHDVLAQVRGDTGPARYTLIKPNIESGRSGSGADYPHRFLGEGANFVHLIGGEIRVIGNVAVWGDQHVPRVIGKQIEDDVGVLSPGDHHGLGVLVFGRDTKRALRLRLGRIPRISLGGFRVPCDINHAVGSPQTLKSVWNSHQRINIGAVVTHGSLYLRPSFNCGDDALDGLGDRHPVVLAAIAETERDRAGVLVFATGNQHEGNFFLRCGADLLGESIVAVVEFGAHSA